MLSKHSSPLGCTPAPHTSTCPCSVQGRGRSQLQQDRGPVGRKPISNPVCVCLCCCFNQSNWSAVIKGSVALIGIGLNSRSKSLLALPLPNNHQQKSNKSNWLQPLICNKQRSWR